jgi:probable rRNA maturation factor
MADRRGNIKVQVLNARGGLGPFLRKHVMQAARLAEAGPGPGAGVITIALVDDAEMRRLHRQHMNLDSTTDVLTFDLRETKTAALEADLVLCVDEATRQARRRGHAVRHELLLYAIHGLLHLLGYDDHRAADAKRMHAREDELLTKLGFGAVFGRPVR